MYGDYIAYDCWLGKVYDLKNQVILKLSNGARYVHQCLENTGLWSTCAKYMSLSLPLYVLLSRLLFCYRCSMSTEDASKLYDVCPHASDSVTIVQYSPVLLCECNTPVNPLYGPEQRTAMYEQLHLGGPGLSMHYICSYLYVWLKRLSPARTAVCQGLEQLNPQQSADGPACILKVVPAHGHHK